MFTFSNTLSYITKDYTHRAKELCAGRMVGEFVIANPLIFNYQQIFNVWQRTQITTGDMDFVSSLKFNSSSPMSISGQFNKTFKIA